MTREYLSMSEGDTPNSLLGFLMKAVASSCVASAGGPPDDGAEGTEGGAPLAPEAAPPPGVTGIADVFDSGRAGPSEIIFSRTSCY